MPTLVSNAAWLARNRAAGWRPCVEPRPRPQATAASGSVSCSFICVACRAAPAVLEPLRGSSIIAANRSRLQRLRELLLRPIGNTIYWMPRLGAGEIALLGSRALLIVECA